MPLDRLVEPAGGAQPLGEIGDQARLVGPQLDRAPAVAQREARPAERGQRQAQEMVRFGMIGPRPEQAPAAPRRALRMAGAQLSLRFEQQPQAGVGRRPRAPERRGERSARLRRHARAAARGGAGRLRWRTRAGARAAAGCRSAAAP
jgi:hypothetical protein